MARGRATPAGPVLAAYALMKIPSIPNTTIGTAYGSIPIWHMLVAVAAVVATMILVARSIYWGLYISEPPRVALISAFFDLLMFLLFFVYLFLEVRTRGFSINLWDPLRKARPSAHLVVITLSLLCLSFSTGSLFELLDFDPSLIPFDEDDRNFVWRSTESAYVIASVLNLMTLVIAAPLVEELFFRGFLFGRLRTRLSTWMSVAIVSLSFAVLHPHVVGSAVFSVVTCLMVIRSGKLTGVFVVHALNNGVIALLMVYWALGLEESLFSLDFLNPSWPLVVIGGGLGIAGLYASRSLFVGPKYVAGRAA
ncbi:CPBP family intramembrane glutamic endopeptidase [Bauldia sp.]|uniref:CPBP family intramembrane glutamic endopeptidase n=1 Tax=Bauldia sp. TaxID=2575872 RepID=UPI003BAD1865